jgi:hypothetical protein
VDVAQNRNVIGSYIDEEEILTYNCEPGEIPLKFISACPSALFAYAQVLNTDWQLPKYISINILEYPLSTSSVLMLRLPELGARTLNQISLLSFPLKPLQLIPPSSLFAK